MNVYTCVAHLVADPELKYGKNEMAFCRFRIAINNSKKIESTFMGCTAFGKLAERIGDNLKKGSHVALTGSIIPDDYEKSDGTKVQRIRFIVDYLKYLDPKERVEEIEEEEEIDDVPF